MTTVDRVMHLCARRPAFAAAAVAGYVALVTATHDHVQDLAYWLQRTFTREVWAPAIAAAGLLAAVAASAAARRRIAASPVRFEAAVAWWATVALLGAVFFSLLATNMEAIHFVQYAIPALAVYVLTRRFGATVLVVTALGAIDETWQYAVLHRAWGIPWDANDIVLNACGACLGCASIVVFAECDRVTVPPRRALAMPIATAIIVFGGALVLRTSGLLAVYPEDGPAAIELSRSPRPEFRWDEPEWGRGHYVLHPATSVAIVVVLAAAFAALDRRVRWRPGASRGDPPRT